MRFAGIDIASETHVLAMVNGDGDVEVKATPFGEDAAGYDKALGLLGTPGEVLVAMEATGHYWKNLFAALAVAGHRVALLNPLRTRRFADEDLERTKTDAIDALGIARFAAQKRPNTDALARFGRRRTAGTRALARTAVAGLRRSRAPVAPPGRPRLSRVHPLRASPRQRARQRRVG